MRRLVAIIASVLALALTPAVAGAAHEVPVTEDPNTGQVTVSDNPSVAWPANQSPPTEAALRGWFDALKQKGCTGLEKFTEYAMQTAGNFFKSGQLEKGYQWLDAHRLAGQLLGLLC
jgi:hypothetical protein